MKNLKKSINSYSFTEKVTVSALFAVLFVFAFSVIAKEGDPASNVLGEEASEASAESAESIENDESESVDDEQSVDNTEESIEEESEASLDNEVSASVASEDETSIPSVEEESEESEAGFLNLTREPSVDNEEESEESVEEVSVSDFENVVEVDENTSVVSRRGRLFYLLPVEITKTLSLDDQGQVVNVQQTVLNRLLELLSF